METYKRVNTVKITFDISATRPSAVEIHHWLSEKMKLKPDQLDTIQLNSRDRSIYVKVISPSLYDKLLQSNTLPQDFKYESGEITKVNISAADTQTITVRCFNLPPEVPQSVLRNALSKYGTVRDVRDEKWSSQYMLPVNNGIKAIRMDLKQPIPATLTIANYDVNFSHPGQIRTCFRCKATTHLKDNCPVQTSILAILPKHKQANIVHLSPPTSSDLQKAVERDENTTPGQSIENVNIDQEVNNQPIDAPMPVIVPSDSTTQPSPTAPINSDSLSEKYDSTKNNLDDDNHANSHLTLGTSAVERMDDRNLDLDMDMEIFEQPRKRNEKIDIAAIDDHSTKHFKADTEPATQFSKRERHVRDHRDKVQTELQSSEQEVHEEKKERQIKSPEYNISSRDPRLKSSDSNIKTTDHKNMKEKPKTTRPHPYAIYGRIKDVNKDDDHEEMSA